MYILLKDFLKLVELYLINCIPFFFFFSKAEVISISSQDTMNVSVSQRMLLIKPKKMAQFSDQSWGSSLAMGHHPRQGHLAHI